MADPSDIVERLRKASNGHPHAKIPWPHYVLHHAADEIERLRAALAAEREECARVVDAQKERWSALATGHPAGSATRDTLSSYAGIAEAIAASIRARGG